jgi:3-hydroxyisobutyrate dehydrogenase-like beta-hydroxyacid dehydrogenase
MQGSSLRDAGVAAIGLGRLGAAIACSLAASGRRVTGWNRTLEKALPLREQGLEIVDDAAAAIAGASLAVFCVSDYEAGHAILKLEGVREALRERTVVQITTGSPEAARRFAGEVAAAGGSVLDGNAAAYPEMIGGPDASLFFSGPRPVWEQWRELLTTLGGHVLYVGEEIDAANKLMRSSILVFTSGLMAFLEAAAAGRALGANVADVTQAAEAMLGLLRVAIRSSGRRIGEKDFRAEEATAEVQLRAAESTLAVFRDAGVPPVMATAVVEAMRRVVEAGRGADDIATAFDVAASQAR